MSSINEACDGKLIGLIDGLGTFDRVDHWTDDNVRIDHDQVVGGRILLCELPRGRLGLDLGHVVSKNGILSLDGLLGRHLCLGEIRVTR